MNISIVIISDNEKLAAFARTKKTSIIPPDIISFPYYKNKNCRFTVLTYNEKFDGDFLSFVRDMGNNPEAIISLFDTSSSFDISEIDESVFYRGFNIDHDCTNPLNVLRKHTARLLREFALLSQSFDDLKYLKVLLLPLQNFSAEELAQLRVLVREGGARYGEELGKLLSKLRDRQKPKKRSKYKTVYLVDDRQLHFEYGHEHHAQVETGIPPHKSRCILNSFLRFGRKFDPVRHFNVTEADGNLKEREFVNCHHEEKTEAGISHLNMFPNNFY